MRVAGSIVARLQKIRETRKCSLRGTIMEPPPLKRGKVMHPEKADMGDLSILPPELLYRALQYLDIPSLANVRVVNQLGRQLATHNSAGWELHKERLWADKVMVCPEARNHPQAFAALQMSLLDAERSHLTRAEFCEQTWYFRFKKSAGADWTVTDPWYRGQPCRKMRFLPDGTVRHGDEEDPPPVRMTWRFVQRPMDLPFRPMGSYLRLSVGGREVPTYAIRRSPTGNWGFIMESCWGLYANFELPPLPRALRIGLEDSGASIDWLYDGTVPLMDEELTITNEMQWREAFLYNVGARVLPEGDEAVEDFDLAWGAIRELPR